MRHFPKFLYLLLVLGCSGSEADPSGGEAGSTSGGSSGEDGSGGTSSGTAGGNSSGSGGTAGEADAGEPGSNAGKGGSSSAGRAGSSGSSGSGGSAGRPFNPGPIDTSCGLPDAAFCDPFVEKSPGGRAGDLDDQKWSIARLGFGCGDAFSFAATPVNFCGVWNTVMPSGPDSVFCLTENNEPRWAEGFHDNTSFNYLSVRIRQPFDFADRTGTIQWEADARTAGGHGWWVETWITEDPVPGSNIHDNQLVSSKNALGIMLALNCGKPTAGTGTNGAGETGVYQILEVNDYQYRDVYDPFAGPQANQRCVRTEQGEMNKFHFLLSQNRIEVWGSHFGETELIPLAEADIDLAFTRGYVNIIHAHYNAEKAEVPSYQSYQWAKVAFDGPVLPTPRAYEIPDPLSAVPTNNTCGPETVYRISYAVIERQVVDVGDRETPLHLAFEGVDLTDATGARLTFNTTHVKAGDTLSYRFNGGTWRDYLVPEINTTWERQGFAITVPVEDLVEGTNSIEFGTNTAEPLNLPPNSMHIANIDLEIDTH